MPLPTHIFNNILAYLLHIFKKQNLTNTKPLLYLSLTLFPFLFTSKVTIILDFVHLSAHVTALILYICVSIWTNPPQAL